MIQVVRLPSSAPFRIGVRFDTIYHALPDSLRSRCGSWPQKLTAMGVRRSLCHCTQKNDINRVVENTSPNPQKTIWVPLDVAKTVFPTLASQIDAAVPPAVVTAISAGAANTGPDPVVNPVVNAVADIPTDDGGPGEYPDGPRAEPGLGISESLEKIELDAQDQFTDHNGHTMEIRMYGGRTRDAIRFNLSDLREVFGRCNFHNTSSISPTSIGVIGARETVRVVDMWDFVYFVGLTQAHGNQNARTLFAWVVDTVFAAQFGEAPTSVPQSMHALGAGTSLPAEFGQRVSGAYAFAFLRGSTQLCEQFPALKEKIANLGIDAASEWYVAKSGHTDNMRRRFGEHKVTLNIHESFCMQHGVFWSTTNKKLASSAESQIQNDFLADYSVKLDGHNFSELFVMIPDLMGETLRSEGQSITNDVVAKALDTSEAKMLRAEHKHRDDMDALKENHAGNMDAMRTAMDGMRVTMDELRTENSKLAANTAALNALRLIVPPKTLAKFNALMPQNNPNNTTT